MNVSQVINNINDNNYDDDITITGIPSGHFPAVTNISIQEGSSTREIEVMIMPLEQSSGGTMNTNSGLFVRKAGEQSVRVKVTQDGREIAENTTSY